MTTAVRGRMHHLGPAPRCAGNTVPAHPRHLYFPLDHLTLSTVGACLACPGLISWNMAGPAFVASLPITMRR